MDSQFTPPVTRIFEVDPASAALVLKADLGQSYTPVFGMAAANARTLYLSGTDTTPADACTGLTSCLLMRVVLDPGSTTPSEWDVVGVLSQGASVVPGFTGLTFRQDGQLYGISQVTDSLYRIDPATAQATLVGSAGVDFHGGDITFDDQDRLWVWTNIGDGAGLYQMDPDTGQASAYELHPWLDFAGMAALSHGGILYGTNPPSDRLYSLDLLLGLDAGVVMTLGGQQFDHRRGDVDSPYCAEDASCDDADVCTTDTCSPGGCLHVSVFLDDGNLCSADSCDPVTGVLHLPVPGCCVSDSTCHDSNSCTLDLCEANRCVFRDTAKCGSPRPGSVRREARDNQN